MTSFTAVVVSCADERGLAAILGQLRYQTRPPDETIAIISDTPNVARLREQFQDVEFLERPRTDDWGHSAREEGIHRATSEWVGFFNSDDRYNRRYLERMLTAGELVDVVYCGWNEQPNCKFQAGSSTAGNFIIRTGLARQVGWTGRHYEADGAFIDRAGSLGLVARVNDILYLHNPSEGE